MDPAAEQLPCNREESEVSATPPNNSEVSASSLMQAEEQNILDIIENTPGVLFISGPAYGLNSNRYADREERRRDINDERIPEVDVIPIISDAIAVPNEILVDGKLVTPINMKNPRTRMLLVTFAAIFVSLIVAIVVASLETNKSAPLVSKDGCREGLRSENFSKCNGHVDNSTRPSEQRNDASPMPSITPTFIKSDSPSTLPTMKRWTLMVSGSDVSNDIFTSYNAYMTQKLSGDGLNLIIGKNRLILNDTFLDLFHVLKWSPENGWKSTSNITIEHSQNSNLAISHDGSVFTVLYPNSVYTIYNDQGKKYLNDDLEKISYKRIVVATTTCSKTVAMALSGDGSRLVVSVLPKLATCETKGYVAMYICDSNVDHNTWTPHNYFDASEIAADKDNKFGSSLAMSSDGSTVAIGSLITGTYYIELIYVFKHKQVNSTWQKTSGHIERQICCNKAFSLSNDGRILALCEVASEKIEIYHYNQYLFKYENAFNVSDGSIFSLSDNGNRIAVSNYHMKVLKVYEIEDKQITSVGQDINPCNTGESCQLESVSLSHDGNRLALIRMVDGDGFWIKRQFYSSTYEFL